MIKRLLYVLCLTAGFSACKKSNTLPSNHFGEIFQVSFTLDNVPFSKVYPKDSINIIQGYTSGQANGNYYFGGGPVYRFGSQRWMEIQFGSAYGPVISNWDSAFASFVDLCSPGSKIYDGIRFADQKQTNRVEITYTDENGDSWSTVKIDASNPVNPKLAPVPIQQTGSTFVITSEKQVSFDNSKNNAVLIKGTFNCTLYKYTTYEQKQVTNGSYVAVFGVI